MLLRLLEQREYRELGSNELRHSSARFVTATNVDLDAAVEEGSFRSDLLSRLSRIVIDVPPLRARREDIVPLARHFAEHVAPGAVTLSRSLALALLRYDWPSNARELQSVIEQAALEIGTNLEASMDPDGVAVFNDMATLDESAGAERTSPRVELGLSMELAERLLPSSEPNRAREITRRGVTRDRPSPEALLARFHELGNNATALADELGVGRTTIYRWFREAGLDVRDLRQDT
jgi:DNA-binding NtrC family response regulator